MKEEGKEERTPSKVGRRTEEGEEGGGNSQLSAREFGRGNIGGPATCPRIRIKFKSARGEKGTRVPIDLGNEVRGYCRGGKEQVDSTHIASKKMHI